MRGMLNFVLRTSAATTGLADRLSTFPSWILWGVPLLFVSLQQMARALLASTCSVLPWALLPLNDDGGEPTLAGMVVLTVLAGGLCYPLYQQPVLSTAVLLALLGSSLMVIVSTACFVFSGWRSSLGLFVALSDLFLAKYVLLSVMSDVRFPGLFRMSLLHMHAHLVPMWLVPQLLYIAAVGCV